MSIDNNIIVIQHTGDNNNQNTCTFSTVVGNGLLYILQLYYQISEFFMVIRTLELSKHCTEKSLHTQQTNEFFSNKRAQRALGRSPEENVKGHSGANNREPQGHNLNNFGRGPFDDVIY